MASWHDPSDDGTAARTGCLVIIGSSLLAWAIVGLIVWAILR